MSEPTMADLIAEVRAASIIAEFRAARRDAEIRAQIAELRSAQAAPAASNEPPAPLVEQALWRALRAAFPVNDEITTNLALAVAETADGAMLAAHLMSAGRLSPEGCGRRLAGLVGRAFEGVEFVRIGRRNGAGVYQFREIRELELPPT